MNTSQIILDIGEPLIQEKPPKINTKAAKRTNQVFVGLYLAMWVFVLIYTA